MDPKLVVLRCAIALSGKQKTYQEIPKSLRLKDLALTEKQETSLLASSCDALMACGYSRSQAFQRVQKVLEELG